MATNHSSPQEAAVASLYSTQDTERTLRLALDAGQMAVWEYDILKQAVIPNEGLKRLLGFPSGKSLDISDLRELYLPGEGEKVRQAALAALSKSEERFFEVEYAARLYTGEERWFQTRAEIITNNEGAPTRVIGVLFDVTARKHAQLNNEKLLATLSEREAELSSALKAGALAVFEYDPQSLEMKASAELNTLYGYPASHSLTLADIRARYHPDMPATEIAEMARQLNDPTVHDFAMDLHILLPDGRSRWLNGRGEYLRDASGKPYRARGIVMDVTAQRELEGQQKLLLAELEHRIKNILATVTAIASRTLSGTSNIGDAKRELTHRFQALGRAHDLAIGANWKALKLREVLQSALQPLSGDERLTWDGPDCQTTARQGLTMALALHELATNALKYGSLSSDRGAVSITWTVDEYGALIFVWRESGGPKVTPPERQGFGTLLIRTALAQDFQGAVQLDYPQSGVVCTLKGAVQRPLQPPR